MTSDPGIVLVDSPAQAARCYPVMNQLRPGMTETEFLQQIQRQESSGYRLVYLEQSGAVCAVAGFRISESLSWGRYLYVDDLVTDETRRSAGHGGALLDWLIDHARQQGCGQFHLDSGVWRHDAHRFYFRKDMFIGAFHFVINLR